MARYTPGVVPSDPKTLPDFLQREFSKIAQALDTADPFLTLDTLYAPPVKYRDGTVCKADGTTWNPGAGAGVYVYRGAAWHFLG